MQDIQGGFSVNLPFRKGVGGIAYAIFLAAVCIGLIGLVTLLVQVFWQGIPWLSWQFLTDYPSRHPEEAGLAHAIVGTVYIMALVAAFTVPVGVGAALYLEEYAPKNRLTRIIEVNIANLAGVPSIVYGLLGLGLFVQMLAMGRSLLAGGLTLSLLVLPIVILASREAIRAVPQSPSRRRLRLGATQWQMIKGVVIPESVAGILTGVILAMSRAIGEAAHRHRHQCLGVPHLPAHHTAGQVHRAAHPDIQLGRRPAPRLPIPRRCGYHRPAGHPALHERGGHLLPQPVSSPLRRLGPRLG